MPTSMFMYGIGINCEDLESLNVLQPTPLTDNNKQEENRSTENNI